MIKNISLDKDKAAELRDFRKSVLIGSNFSFLASHFGLRPKAMHVLLAPSHAGKTTLTLSLIKSLLIDPNNKEKNVKIASYFSEESLEDIALHLSDMGLIGTRVEEVDMISEIDQPRNELELFEYIEHVQPDVFIFDNLTTSKLYGDKRPSEQADFIQKLKAVVKRSNTALFAVAHTNNLQAMNLDRMIAKEDIRGSKTVVNLAEFFYILQPVVIENSKHVFLYVDKHRGYQVPNNFFLLQYDPHTKTIQRDFPVSFEDFKNKFKQRNSLKGRA